MQHLRRTIIYHPRPSSHPIAPTHPMTAPNAARLALRPSLPSRRFTGKTGPSRPAHTVTASAAAFHSSSITSDAARPKDGTGAALAPGQGTKPSSSALRHDDGEGDNDSALAFGGGASSRGGPSSAPSIADVSHADIFIRPQPSSGTYNSSSKSAYSQSTMISGSAGKGAVPGYGKRRAGMPDGSRTTTRERDDEIVRGYEHTVGSWHTCRSDARGPHLNILRLFSLLVPTVRPQQPVSRSTASAHVLLQLLDVLQCSCLCSCLVYI